MIKNASKTFADNVYCSQSEQVQEMFANHMDFIFKKNQIQILQNY